MIIFILLLRMYVYKNNNNVNEVVNKKLTFKLEIYEIKDRQVTSSDTQDERINLFNIAIENENGYKLGTGIGSTQTYNDPSTRKHFGMSEIYLRTY